MKIAIAAAALALIVPAAASAQTTGWSGLSGSIAYSEADTTNNGPNLGAITGRLSWQSPYYLGVEGEASGGVKKDTVSGIDFKLNNQFAAYVTATAPITPNFDIFGRVGYGRAKLSSTPTGFGGSENSWNYGVGANWFWDGRNGVRADYTRMNFENSAGFDANVYSVGYVRRF